MSSAIILCVVKTQKKKNMRRTWALFAGVRAGKRSRPSSSKSTPKGGAKPTPQRRPSIKPTSTAQAPKVAAPVPQPLVQRTGSPWVWASADLDSTEASAFEVARLGAAERYFQQHGAQARYVEPAEFNYEVSSRGCSVAVA